MKYTPAKLPAITALNDLVVNRKLVQLSINIPLSRRSCAFSACMRRMDTRYGIVCGMQRSPTRW